MKPRLLIYLVCLLHLSLRAEPIRADLCVIEATPGGVACAVRAAREGVNVVLINRTTHPGGILSSGLGVWDTVWEGKRSPIYDELRQEIFDHYKNTYGEDSSQYRHALPGKSGHTNGKFEPRVVEKLIREMIEAESNITFLTGWIPESVERNGRLIHSVTLRRFEGDETRKIIAKTFADCTYEGDLLPLSNVAYRVGREAREEFDEPHAGVIYMRSTKQRPEHITDEQWQEHENLNLRSFPGFQEIVLPESTGAADKNVQAFNYRTILTDDPENRIPASKPENYDPGFLKTLEYGSIVHPIPNRKIGWNRPQLVGPHQAWVEGNWITRQQILDAHWNATMGMLWFLQHDPSVPEKKQKFWLRHGLAKDEFPDNDHRPYEICVREARRLEGRYMLTQHDLMPVPGTLRTPAHRDAVAMTDWYADSHAVTGRGNGIRGSLDEGKMMLHAETWPGQIPWRCLLPKEIDNLVVPVCFSATHVAWGAIRLEPTWMQTGEAAGYAAALAQKQDKPVAELDSDLLVRTLASNQFLLSFFNDTDPADSESAQYFGTHGFFNGYNARLNESLTEEIRDIWRGVIANKTEAREVAKQIYQAAKNPDKETGETRGEFLRKLFTADR